MKGVEPAPPEHAVLLEPLVHLDQGLRTEAVDPALRVVTYVDQPGLPQHPQVPGHARTGDRERLGQLPRAGRMVAQDLQDRAPALVGQRVQHGIHGANVTHRLRTRKGTYFTSAGLVAGSAPSECADVRATRMWCCRRSRGSCGWLCEPPGA